MSVNSGRKATKIIGQRKAFYRQRIWEFSRAKKETINIDILVISKNGDKKIMQSISIRSRPPFRKKQVKPVDPVLKPRFQEKQQVKDQQPCISVFVACLTILNSNWGHQPRHGNSIPYMGVWSIYRDTEQPQEKETS